MLLEFGTDIVLIVLAVMKVPSKSGKLKSALFKFFQLEIEKLIVVGLERKK